MPLRYGMVGGAAGGFFGAVHRMAARLDGQFDLVAGAFSADPDRSRAAGALIPDPSRAYASWSEMAIAESQRPDGVDLVAVVTPNHLHHDIASHFLLRGINVLCEKPMTLTTTQANTLATTVHESGCIFAMAHTYTGYPMVRQARAMIHAGLLGTLRLVHVAYLQGWLAAEGSQRASKQAEWRDDPARAGQAGAVGDIGSHAYNLACVITGEQPEALAADLHSLVPGRVLDDNAHILLRYKGGARGLLTVSQAIPGTANGIHVRIVGSQGALEWMQETPDLLLHTPLGEPTRQLLRGMNGLSAEATRATRLPSGHPEGYVEALGQIYADLADAIRAKQAGLAWSAPAGADLSAGVAGMAFIEAAVASSRASVAWVKLST